MKPTTKSAMGNRHRVNSFIMLALLGSVVVIAVGATRTGQDVQRVTRLELVDADGKVAMVLDVSTAGRPRISVIDGENASLFEFSTTDVQIVSPKPADAEGDEPSMGVSRIRFDALQAIAGAMAADPNANTPADSLAIQMRYLQEQIDSLRREQGEMERDMKQNVPRGHDTSDPLRLQRVIDDLQREARDLRNDLTRAERDNDDLTRRVRTIESKIRE